MKPISVMIAGIGGASLGTEIYKSLKLADAYTIFGCDISSNAYGLYEPGFSKTYHVDRNCYVQSVLDCCIDAGATFLVPGGEQPMTLLGKAATTFKDAGIQLLSNCSTVVASFSDKQAAFKMLGEYGFEIPRTIELKQVSDVSFVGLPCIVKPSTGTGGSVNVFYTTSADEAMAYAEFIRRAGSQPIAQEYIDISDGEYTIGVLSLPDTRVVGSIALRRAMDAKLSVAFSGRGGIVSSGYSQGYIDEYPELCHQAESIARAIGSKGPINIQGRVRRGVFLPFEINPRFSASTFLRAMAGFNEVDMLLRFYSTGEIPQRRKIKSGWYLRSLCERYIPQRELK
jgi:carbamoyl-phosphate synthase large subunit